MTARLPCEECCRETRRFRPWRGSASPCRRRQSRRVRAWCPRRPQDSPAGGCRPYRQLGGSARCRRSRGTGRRRRGFRRSRPSDETRPMSHGFLRQSHSLCVELARRHSSPGTVGQPPLRGSRTKQASWSPTPACPPARRSLRKSRRPSSWSLRPPAGRGRTGGRTEARRARDRQRTLQPHRSGLIVVGSLVTLSSREA
jgi:hypothetical protein